MTVETTPNSTLSPSPKKTTRRRKKLRRLLVLGVGLIGVLVLSRRSWLPWLHDYLDVSQPPRPADVVVILGGNGPSRTATAVDLYTKGMVSRMIISGCFPDLDSGLAMIEEKGVPSTAIIGVVHASTTWDEAKQVLALLQSEGATSALIVTDKYHTRRARATYAHLTKDLDIELTFVASSDKLTSNNWWQTGSGRFRVLSEYAKLSYYFLRYGIWPWEN